VLNVTRRLGLSRSPGIDPHQPSLLGRRRLARNDPVKVRTKFFKTFTTWFFPVGEDIEQIVSDWVERLRRNMLFGDGDPLIPATRVAVGEDKAFYADGLATRPDRSAPNAGVIDQAIRHLEGARYQAR
jgi:hypothetical protein